MARLDSKSDTQLIYLAGSLIETLNDSMRGSNRISRENDANKGLRLDANTYTDRQSVVIKGGQEGIINQFMTLVGQRNKTLAVNLDLETSDPINKRIKFGSLSASYPGCSSKGNDFIKSFFVWIFPLFTMTWVSDFDALANLCGSVFVLFFLL